MNYKGGKIRRGNYWYIKAWDHPRSGKQGYVAEHRLVMEKKIGRFLTPEEAVHHIDHDGLNNSPDNLELYATHGEHTKEVHSDLFERQRTRFKGKHFSPRTEFKKGFTPWNKGSVGMMVAWNRGTATTENRICEYCDKAFVFKVAPSKVGRGRFCSVQCHNDIRRK